MQRPFTTISRTRRAADGRPGHTLTLQRLGLARRRPDAPVKRLRWAVVAVVVLAASACGRDGSSSEEPSGAVTTVSGRPAVSVTAPAGEHETPTTTAPRETSEADGEAFPVTVEHRYGTTTIESRPLRIVTVGLTDQDALLALGVVPVGTTEWFGGHPGAVWPWAQDELGDGPTPEIVGTAAEINFEKVAALDPDLILAVYSGVTESEYRTLSAIAPTVAQPADVVDYGVSWEDQTLTIGRTVGLATEAEELVADLLGRFADARDAHPAFEGTEGLVATPYEGSVFVYAPEDARGRFMDALGFVDVAEITALAGDGFGSEISYERLDLVDVDALVWIVDDIETDVATFRDEPLYARLDVSHEGRDVFVENLSELGGATSFVSVLSLPTLLDSLVPMLAAAVDGDPATPVR